MAAVLIATEQKEEAKDRTLHAAARGTMRGKTDRAMMMLSSCYPRRIAKNHHEKDPSSCIKRTQSNETWITSMPLMEAVLATSGKVRTLCHSKLQETKKTTHRTI